MKKNLLLTASASLLLIGGIASADFKASGTAYSKALAAQEKWTNDAANEFVSMPNSFACIISNSGVDVNLFCRRVLTLRILIPEKLAPPIRVLTIS